MNQGSSQQKRIQQLLKLTQQTMLNSLQQFLPKNYDYSQLTQIYQQSKPNLTLHQINYKLTQYFVSKVKQNFITIRDYKLLEEQTQKLQSTVRNHIKVQQQMKMYLEHIEAKTDKSQINITKQFQNEIMMLKDKQNILIQQNMALSKKIDSIIKQLEKKQQQIRILRHNTQHTRLFTENITKPTRQNTDNSTEKFMDRPYSYRKSEDQESSQQINKKLVTSLNQQNKIPQFEFKKFNSINQKEKLFSKVHLIHKTHQNTNTQRQIKSYQHLNQKQAYGHRVQNSQTKNMGYIPDGKKLTQENMNKPLQSFLKPPNYKEQTVEDQRKYSKSFHEPDLKCYYKNETGYLLKKNSNNSHALMTDRDRVQRKQGAVLGNPKFLMNNNEQEYIKYNNKLPIKKTINN